MVKMMLGCDPEFFLRRKGNKHQVSAHNLVPGTKREPHKLPNGGAVQADGTAVEFNTEPADNGKMFADNVMSCLNDIRKMIDSKYEFVFKPVVEYGVKTYDKIPDNSKELGCDPDYNAYTLVANERPVPPRERMRTGAGHLHIGWVDGVKDPHNEHHMNDCAFMVKKLDGTLYYHAIRHWASGPDEALRRRVYGKLGAFRPKPFGVEYRSLSNTWLQGGPVLYTHIYEYTYQVFLNAVENKRLELPWCPPFIKNPYM